MRPQLIVMAADHQALTTALFLAVVALTIGITFWADQRRRGLLRGRPRLQRVAERPGHWW
jgi:hypothetical protein